MGLNFESDGAGKLQPKKNKRAGFVLDLGSRDFRLAKTTKIETKLYFCPQTLLYFCLYRLYFFIVYCIYQIVQSSAGPQNPFFEL